MTLRELRASHPELFRANQDWFEGEAFMDFDAADYYPLPIGVMQREEQQEKYGKVTYPYVAALLSAYVKEPNAKVWDRYLWCADTDSAGQRVFVGKNNGLMEIHRHIHLSTRFGVPVTLETWHAPAEDSPKL